MSELRDAAERLLKGPRAYRDGKHSEQADLQAVADAYLAEHPADEDVEIAGGWLRSVGFKSKRVEGVATYARGNADATLFVVEGYTDGYWACVGKYMSVETAIGKAAHFDKRLHTRGDVRTLCRALGIELQETRDG